MRARHNAAKAFGRGIDTTTYTRLYTMPNNRLESREITLVIGFNKNRKSKRPKVAGKRFIRNTVDEVETTPKSMQSILN